MAKKSLDRIFDFVQKFAKVENSLEKFHQIFKCLLPYCYKLLDLPKMNIKLKDDIQNYISYQNQTFDNIEKCINGLFQNVKDNKSIKIYFNDKNSNIVVTISSYKGMFVIKYL